MIPTNIVSKDERLSDASLFFGAVALGCLPRATWCDVAEGSESSDVRYGPRVSEPYAILDMFALGVGGALYLTGELGCAVGSHNFGPSVKVCC